MIRGIKVVCPDTGRRSTVSPHRVDWMLKRKSGRSDIVISWRCSASPIKGKRCSHPRHAAVFSASRLTFVKLAGL